MLFRAVQNGLCAMAEKKSSPEKNEVPTPCPPCPQVSRAGEGREGKVGGQVGPWMMALLKRLSPRGITAIRD